MVDSEGLRARKRRAAMVRIQTTALDLFDEHGFGAVTIERIADTAEVSASSVYRYFGTKEGIVLYDPNETAITLDQVNPGEAPLDTFRLAAQSFLSSRGDGDDVLNRRRVRYLMEVPSVQAATAQRIFGPPPPMAQRVADRMGGATDDLNVMVTWGAMYGALLNALRYWHANDYKESLSELLDRTFTALRNLD